MQLHYGPTNKDCAKGGFPKLTELQIAFSRDGFHWDRSNRNTFIGATLKKNSWERAYIHSTGGVCNIVNDKLHFYYTAFQGDESKKLSNDQKLDYWSGMYANASTGLAILRRDGFASMNAGKVDGFILTRPLKFSGKFLFINIECTKYGMLTIEVCNVNGIPVQGFTRKDCLPLCVNSTKQIITWKNGNNLESLAGTPLRFKFYLTNTKIYAFWVSANRQGVSAGSTAAGGPGLTGNWEV